jgi:glutamyl-tRNA synthetase
MEKIRIRFAPSPTGFLHLGGARTALLNWLFARRYGGEFILRIEDTDRERSTQEAVRNILESLKWLGLNWNEGPETGGSYGPYFQMKRLSLYGEQAEKLLKEDKAYRDEGAIRFRIPEGETVFTDTIRGEIKFLNRDLKDPVIIKSNNIPTYNFACVVDDALMEISHVIRGEDHISNTPLQINIYEALGFKKPEFLHLPLIHGSDGTRLSKRHGPTTIGEYRDKGFLPQAMRNYLALLGWSPRNKAEILTTDQLIKLFSIEGINRSYSIFDEKKFTWINSQHLRILDDDTLARESKPFVEKAGLLEGIGEERLKEIAGLLKPRLHLLSEVPVFGRYLFPGEIEYPGDILKVYLSDKVTLSRLQELYRILNDISDFKIENLENIFKDFIREKKIKFKDIAQPLRVAISGMTVTPGIFETMSVMGKALALKRLRKGLEAAEGIIS